MDQHKLNEVIKALIKADMLISGQGQALEYADLQHFQIQFSAKLLIFDLLSLADKPDFDWVSSEYDEEIKGAFRLPQRAESETDAMVETVFMVLSYYSKHTWSELLPSGIQPKANVVKCPADDGLFYVNAGDQFYLVSKETLMSSGLYPL